MGNLSTAMIIPNLPELPNDWLLSQNTPADVDPTRFVGIEVQQEYRPTLGVPLIYGFQRIDPPVIYITTDPNNSELLYVVYMIGEAQTGQIWRLFVDDHLVFNTESVDFLPHNTIVRPTVGDKLRPGSDPNQIFAEFEYIDGRTPTARSLLLQQIGRGIRLDYVSYVVCRFRFNNQLFRGLPKVTVDLWGIRTRSLLYYSSAFSTRRTTMNPVDHLLDLMTNTVYGAGIPDDQIDLDSFESVYAYIENTRIKEKSTDIGYILYPCHVTMSSGTKLIENVRMLLNNFGMIMSYTNGQYTLTIEAQTSTTHAIDQSDIIGGITIRRPDQQNKYNRFVIEYQDVSNNFAYLSQQYPKRNLADRYQFDAEDNGYIRANRLELRCVGYAWTARQIAQKLLKKSRLQNTYTFKMTRTGYQYVVGDVLSVTTSIPQLTNELMRIISLKLNDDFTVDITAVTHNNDFFPPFVDVDLDFSGGLSFTPPNNATTAPIDYVNQPEPEDPPPQPGDIGGTVITVPTPPVATLTFSMNNIQQPSSGLAIGSPSELWPTLRTSTAGLGVEYRNVNWYIGQIWKQNLGTLNSTWSAKSGNYAYTIINPIAAQNLNHSFYSQQNDNYSFGIEADFMTLSQSRFAEVQGGSGGNICFRQSFYVTYRDQDDANINLGGRKSDNGGRYKNSDYLVWVYSMDGNRFGWQRDLSGSRIVRYYTDFENSNTVEVIDSSGVINNVDWRTVLNFMPQLRWRQNPYREQGGYYGGIDDSDGRSCLQYLYSQYNTNRRGVDCSWPITLGPPVETASEGEKMIFKVYNINVDTGQRPEFLGFLESTTFVGVANTLGLARARVSQTYYQTVRSGQTLPVLS